MAGLYTDAMTDDREYRHMLKKTSDSLSRQNIVILKFLCADIISASKLEKITTGIAIWKELEDRCLLSAKDYCMLTELLYYAERRDLIKQLTNTNADEVQRRIKEGNSKISPYRVFLNKLGLEIPQKQLDEVKYLFTSDLSNSAREGAKDIWTLLLLLERQDILTSGKVECLREIAHIIDRQDLVDLICDFKDDSRMMNYDSGKLLESSDDSFYDLKSTSWQDTSNASPGVSNRHSTPSNSQYTSSSRSSARTHESTPIQATEDHTGTSAFSPVNCGPTSHQLQHQLNYTNSQNFEHASSMQPTEATRPQNNVNANNTMGNAAVPHIQVSHQDQHASNSSSEFLRYPTSSRGSQELPEDASILHSDLAEKTVSTISHQQHHHQPQNQTREATRETTVVDNNEVGAGAMAPEDVGLMSMELPLYNMTSIPRGYCVIINNETFRKIDGDKRSKKLSNRPGSNVDAGKLDKTFKWLGFKVLRYNNCTVEKMIQIFEKLTVGKNLDNSDALVICILSHGIFGALYGSDGYEMKIAQILGYFKPDACQSLAHKPKIFFLAACQGRAKQTAAQLPPKIHTDDASTQLDDDLPKDADFLIGYATVPGYVSFRHEDDGTWYIRTLVERLHKWADKEDLMSIMIDVNRLVAQHSAIDGQKIYKQMPLPYTTLTKKIFLKPVHDLI